MYLSAQQDVIPVLIPFAFKGNVYHAWFHDGDGFMPNTRWASVVEVSAAVVYMDASVSDAALLRGLIEELAQYV